MYDKVKIVLRNALLNSSPSVGYNKKNPEVFEKTSQWPRRNSTVSMYDTYIEVCIREYPASEGWSKKKYRYTYKNVQDIVRMV